jgi:hypothetical protein
LTDFTSLEMNGVSGVEVEPIHQRHFFTAIIWTTSPLTPADSLMITCVLLAAVTGMVNPLGRMAYVYTEILNVGEILPALDIPLTG